MKLPLPSLPRAAVCAFAVFNLLAAPVHAADAAKQKKGGGIDWNERAAPWGKLWNAPVEAQKRPGFKLFDNLYYVGLHTVAAYLITTSDGLVLLDAGYANTTDFMLESIKQAGFDPKAIKHIIISHAHGDHFAGAGTFVQLSGARVIMSELDWEETERRQASGLPTNGLRLKRDLVVRDGETMKIGDTPFTFYVTPGHTAGALTTAYPVKDGNRTYRAVSPGGLGFNFGPEWTEPYVKSFERLKTLGPFDTVLPNHAYMGPRDLFDVEKELKTRGAGWHPAAYGPQRINAWIDQILNAARQKLDYEKQHREPSGK
jgi:metallo-beta-lactamase class B